MANAIRALSMDAVQIANSGHPGMPMGMADVATTLFSKFLKFDAKNPNWHDRDRFVLSAGHGSMLLYSLLYLTGYDGVSLDDIKNFRQLDSVTPGHPEYGHTIGVETTTGPLGQGLANGVGFALAERMMNTQYGDDLVDHHTYVIAGDGCLMEGISHEAVSMAGHLKLNKLIVLFDDNGITIDGATDISVSDDQMGRFVASGWDVQAIDGHDQDAVATAIAYAKTTDTPSMIACKTTIGYGSPAKAGTSGSHGAPLGSDEIVATKAQLGWNYDAFEIPENILQAWRAIGTQNQTARQQWENRLAQSPATEDFNRRMQGQLTAGWQNAIDALKQTFADEQPKLATRASSQKVLDTLSEHLPELVGGSADLTGSNNTKAASMPPITANDYSGRYIYYGVREHGMSACMNGMALHGGFVPYGGTFLVFSDYCRGAIRLSALMGQRVIYVMSHDSIGLGEDGPTHQPVEHLAALRAMPNLDVYRPADAMETAECWQACLQTTKGPSMMVLSRQGLPTVRTTYTAENLCAKGGYILSDSTGDRQLTIIASGSEVEIALNAQSQLQGAGVTVAVVSMPCLDVFNRQTQDYQQSVLGTTPRLVVEASVEQSWGRILGADGIFVGMNSFGASAPADQLFQKFGITTQNAVKLAKTLV